MSVAAMVLAAGASTRLGYPKQTVSIGGETLVQRTVRIATEAGLAPVLVVVRPGTAFAGDLSGCVIVTNDQAGEGIASSIRCGVLALKNVVGAVILTCDQVLLRPAHLRALCADAGEGKASRYAGRAGVPAYFPATAFGPLSKLTGDTGARELLQGVPSILDEALALDIDTQADLEQAYAQLQKS